MPKKTPVEDQYQLYLKRIGLSEKMMHPQQKIQLRQTFFGAWGQLLFVIQEGDELPDDKFEEHIDDMMSEMKEFWRKQTANRN